MSDRYGSYPPDEPVIGGSYPPPGSPIPAQGEPYIGAPPRFEDEAEAWDDGDDPGEYDDDQYDDDYYDDGYDGEAPARQPMFYVFIGLAALIGGIIIVLLFSLVNGSGGGGDTPASTAFKVFIDSPTPNMRIEIGKPEDVLVRAKASEPITRFELFVGDQPVDALSVTKPSAADDTYSATLRLPAFDKKGNNQIFVRVTAASGEHKDSDKITVIAFEPVGAKPLFIKGKAVADATVREGPGDIFPVVKTLTAGTEVTILGRTRDSDWLLIDMDNGRWVKRNAIGELGDSLSLVPVKDPTPVPQPSATNTAVPSPSPSVSPTPNGKLPDFVPQNATLTDGGAKLRVTIGNPSSNNYTGPLVVSVSGVNPGTLSQAFSVNLPANGSATVEFDLNPPLTTQKTATIKVDPDNAVKEANEDNNRVDFGLTPATSQPDLVITTVDPGANSITIGIRNNGAALPASEITIRVTVGGAKAELTKTLALAKGQDASFSVAKPGSGAGRVDVLISGISVASKEITLAP